jgi:hypothetical protein
MSTERRWLRYAAIAGIVAVVLIVIGGFLPGAPPSPGDPIDRLRAFFANHRSTIVLGNYVSGLGAVFALWFFSALRSILRRAEGGDGVLANTSFAGGIATVIFAGLGASVTGVLALDPQRDDAVVRGLFDAGNIIFAMLFFFWGLFILAASAVIVRTRVLPVWLGWAGVIVTLVFLISSAGMGMSTGALAAGGPFAFLGFALGQLWILATAITVLRTVKTLPA